MNIRKVIFTALLGLVSQLALAQGVRISGTLSDNEGPVMMGNVVEIDANNRIVSATQTDFNGNFSLQVKSTKNKLVFSYVGDKTRRAKTAPLVYQSFNWQHGAFVGSITNRDYPMIMVTTIILAALIVVMNLVSDVLYKVVDPRIQLN